MIPQRRVLAVAILTMMGTFGCPVGPPDWECYADKPCPDDGELCVAPKDLPEASTEPATDPACYTVCSSSAQCPGGNRACLGQLCVLFDDDCSNKECPEGFFCNTAAHCEKFPSTAGCDNLVRDGDESDADCGGSCTPCADGRRCNGASDCQSDVCDSAGSCAVPTCADGVANGTEIGIDCGGGCAALCPAGEPCRDDGDCESGVCSKDDNVCQAATCDDAVANQGETAVDCGGPCAGCPDGFPCNGPDDCESHVCAAHKCAPGTCSDGAENGDETDVDCGGSCGPCAAGLNCGVASDCDSGVCDAGVCRLLLSFGSTVNDLGESVAVDTNDSILVTGSSSSGLDLGGGVVPPGSFRAKLQSSGEHVWSEQLPVINHNALTLDVSGNTLVVGDAGRNDIYLGSFSPGGGENWSKLFNCVGGRGWAESVAGDSDGNVVVAGAFGGELSFGGGCSTLSSVDTDRAFVAKFSTSGRCAWAKDFGDGETVSYSHGVSVAADGSVVATGSFTNTIDLGNGVRTSAGSYDVFVVRLSADGSHDWSMTFGGSGSDVGRVVADTSDGVVLVGRYWSETINLDGGELLENQGGSDLLVAKLALDDGSHLWSKSFGSAGRDYVGSKVGVDADENIILAGSFESTIGFGDTLLSSAGGYDMFVAMLSPAGAPIGSHRFGGPDNDRVGAVALDNLGRAVVVGTFGGTVDFGGSTLTSAGSDDICVFTVAP